MDVVAGVASVTQLAVYCQSAAKYLLQLYSTSRDALSLVKCQQEDILVLLRVIHRLIHDNSSLDSDLLLPVLIRVIDIARTLSNWFEESGVLGIKWTLVKRRSQIDDALKTLKQKSDILGLYLVERNHTILLRLETNLNKETKDIVGSIENMSQDISGKPLRKKSKFVEQVMNSAQTSASESSAGQSLVRRDNMDEGIRRKATAANLQLKPYRDPPPRRDQQPHRNQEPYRDEQPQHHQPQYPRYPFGTQSNQQPPQERQRTTSGFRMCDNELDESHMSIGNNWQDGYRGLNIECSGNVGKKSTYNAFNGNDGKRAQEEQRLKVSGRSSHR